MLKFFIPVFIFTAVMAADAINGIAILVKDQPITMYEITKEMQKRHTSLSKTVDLLIRRKLEEIEVKERNIHVSSEEVFGRIKEMADQNKITVLQLYDAIAETRKMSEAELKAELKKTLLSQKLYQAIAFSHIDKPTVEEQHEYYDLHRDMFSHPESFSVTVYSAASKSRLKEKIDNPMFYAPDVRSEHVELKYNAINPRLAKILGKTKDASFSPILPAPDGGHMSFYMEDKKDIVTQPFEAVQNQISNAIMGEKREQVLSDYFDRLRLNAGIKIIRLPEG